MAVKQVAEGGVVSVQEVRVGTVRNVRLDQGLDITVQLCGVDFLDVSGHDGAFFLFGSASSCKGAKYSFVVGEGNVHNVNAGPRHKCTVLTYHDPI